MSARPGALLPLDSALVAGAGGAAGAKAARLASALRAGLPVLPGWAAPVELARPALRAGAAQVRAGRPAAARRAVLASPLPADLADELAAAARALGGRVIVRSSSPLEADPRWSGAFSSVAEVRPDDVGTAVRSCWASAFAADPLGRLESSGLPVDALEMGLVIQPEIRPQAGGVARVEPRTELDGQSADVIVEGVRGHPGAMLAGWADAAADRCRGAAADADGALARLLGADVVASVARLALAVWRELGEDAIEWAAAADGSVHLLQAGRSGRQAAAAAGVAAGAVAPARARAAELDVMAPGGGRDLTARQWMPLLAAVVQARGRLLPARPAAPGTAAGRLVAVRPHDSGGGLARDAVLLADSPAPALAPLLFGARAVIARTGAAGSHLAEVARSLGVPMVVGCRVDVESSGPGGWLAAVDGDTGEVALLPAAEAGAPAGGLAQPGF